MYIQSQDCNFFLRFLTTSYLSNNLAIRLLVPIKFNIIETKPFLIRSAPNKLCHTHKWPIKAAKQNEVIYLRITNYNSNDLVTISFLFFKNTDTEKYWQYQY